MAVNHQNAHDAIRIAERHYPSESDRLIGMARPLQARIRRDTHKEFVGQNLIDARKAIGLTQAALARELKIPPNKLNQWEKGLYYPDPWLLKQLCEERGFTMDWFYRRVLAGVSVERAADLRQVMAEAEAA